MSHKHYSVKVKDDLDIDDTELKYEGVQKVYEAFVRSTVMKWTEQGLSFGERSGKLNTIKIEFSSLRDDITQRIGMTFSWKTLVSILVEELDLILSVTDCVSHMHRFVVVLLSQRLRDLGAPKDVDGNTTRAEDFPF